MKNILTPIVIIALIIFIGTGIILAQSQNLVVISNSKGAPPEITLTELVTVMKGEKQRWADGTRISVALMKSSTPAGETTSKKIYGMSGDEMNKFWLALVFQGKAKAPVFFNTASELEAYISQTPGAIGIIEESPDIKSKPVMVDGKKFL